MRWYNEEEMEDVGKYNNNKELKILRKNLWNWIHNVADQVKVNLDILLLVEPVEACVYIFLQD